MREACHGDERGTCHFKGGWMLEHLEVLELRELSCHPGWGMHCILGSASFSETETQDPRVDVVLELSFRGQQRFTNSLQVSPKEGPAVILSLAAPLGC